MGARGQSKMPGLVSVPSLPAVLALRGPGVLASFYLLPSPPPDTLRPRGTEHSSPLPWQGEASLPLVLRS